MTENRTRAQIIGDRWLIIIALTLVAITAWNSRYSLIPAPTGYARYAKHGISFLYPSDLNLWEHAVNEDFSVVLDGSRDISENWGDVGWNSGNVDVQSEEREGYFREFSVIWLHMDTSLEKGEIQNTFHNALETSYRNRNRELNMTRGLTGSLKHRRHEVEYEFFNYTTRNVGEEDLINVYGILAGFYCDKSDRTIALYYLDIYDFDPIYDEESLIGTLKFYLDSIHCH